MNELPGPEKPKLQLAVLISGTGRTFKDLIDLAAEVKDFDKCVALGSLATTLRLEPLSGVKFSRVEIAGRPLQLYVRPIDKFAT